MPFLLGLACCLADPQSPADALEVAIATVEQQEREIRSWRLEYKTTARTRSLGLDGKMGGQRSEFVELRSGDMYRSSMKTQSDAETKGADDVVENAFDGTGSSQFHPEAGRGGIKSARGHDPAFLSLVYTTDRPLSEMLKRAAESDSARWVESRGRALLECRVDERNGLWRIYQLDPRQGWQPVRVVLDHPPLAGPSGEPSREVLTVDVLEFFQRDAVFVPKMAHRVIDRFEGQRAGVRDYEMQVVASSLELNPQVAASDFRIAFPEGTEVFDKDRRVLFTVGPNGEELSVRHVPASGAKGPVQAGGLWIWWADSRIWLAVSLAVCGLMAGIVWRQRRQHT
ncbi:MAG: hypothetical protein KF774_19950 [Planctomyces sp.]|nr:hypothetical protein [Planctomyces sp.]